MARTKRWVWSGAPKESNSQGAHSSGSLPDQSSGTSRVALRELMNASSLLVAAVSPPMRDARAPRSCGTDQVYCTALPSSKPNLPARFELGRLEGGARREAPVGAAGLD